MKVRIAIEQTIELDQLAFKSTATKEEKVAFLIDRFAEDIDTLVKYNEVYDNISVTYLED